MTRKITPIEINGKHVLIELESVEITMPPSANNTNDTSVSDLGEGYELVSSDDSEKESFLKEKVADISDMISSVVSSVDTGMNAVKPDEWGVEFTIGYTVEKDIKILPFISGKGSMNGGIKVSAKWKTDKNTDKD